MQSVERFVCQPEKSINKVMRPHRISFRVYLLIEEKMIDTVLLDIDGVLTDGAVYVDASGKEIKRIPFGGMLEFPQLDI